MKIKTRSLAPSRPSFVMDGPRREGPTRTLNLFRGGREKQCEHKLWSWIVIGS